MLIESEENVIMHRPL